MHEDTRWAGMDVWYEGSRTWLATDRTKEGFLYEEAMMCNQRSPVLLPFQVRYQDSKKYYLYDITGKVSLQSELMRSRASLTQILEVIRSLVCVCDAAEEYLLDAGSIIMDPSMIFLDLSQARLSFTLVPGRAGDFTEGIRDLSAQLLSGADHQDQDCVLLVYDFFRLVREPDFCLAGLKRFTEDAVRDIEPEPREEASPYENIPAEEAGDPSEAPAVKKVTEKRSRLLKLPLKAMLIPLIFAGLVTAVLAAYLSGGLSRVCLQFGIPLDERWLALGLIGSSGSLMFAGPWLARHLKAAAGAGKGAEPKQGAPEDVLPSWDEAESLWAEDEMTRLLLPPPQAVFCRLDPSGGEDLVISAFPSVIGCGQDADVRLEGAGISRRHVLVGLEGDQVSLCDAASTNGTFLNGRRLKKKETVFLSEGDEIMIANIRFRYQKLYP